MDHKKTTHPALMGNVIIVRLAELLLALYKWMYNNFVVSKTRPITRSKASSMMYRQKTSSLYTDTDRREYLVHTP